MPIWTTTTSPAPKPSLEGPYPLTVVKRQQRTKTELSGLRYRLYRVISAQRCLWLSLQKIPKKRQKTILNKMLRAPVPTM